MSSNLPINPDNAGELLLYQTEDGLTRVEAKMVNESVWLSLGQMADLFQRDKSVISRHISNILRKVSYPQGQLLQNLQQFKPRVIVRFSARSTITTSTSSSPVGYRVKSHRGTQFRIWATQRLREYIIKGFAMDDERLKQAGGGNY